MTFTSLGLSEKLQQSLERLGFKMPTPIQTKAIPALLEGNDLLGCAQTGSGKTAAFVLPMLQHLHITEKTHHISYLILTPTRELALQVADTVRSIDTDQNLGYTVIIGGIAIEKQISSLKRRPQLLIATPGRLVDMLQKKMVDLSKVQYLVLDEADQMFDVGFAPSLHKIVAYLPKHRQTALFSATMPEEIRVFAKQIQHVPVEVETHPVSSAAPQIEQRVYWMEKSEKKERLHRYLQQKSEDSTLIFVQTKHGADHLVRYLSKRGIETAAIHGNKSQPFRTKTLDAFRSGKLKHLIATDIAARGIDIEKLPLVINFDMPKVAETYVHRIGRTGRAGHSGIATSFCTEEDTKIFKSIERLLQTKITEYKSL